MYAPADGALGALLYLRQATLVAHPFDPDRLAFVGEPVPIIEGVGNFGALGFFSAGAGVIAYRSGSRGSGIRESQLTWLDRSGKPTSVVGRLGSYDGISLSSDGTRAAVIQVGPSDTGLGNVDIWTIDLARGISQRLTSHDSSDRFPTWSPKGDQIVFHSMRSGSADLNIVSSTGGAEAGIFTSKAINAPTSWSSDGRFVLFHSFDPGSPADIWLLPLTGERKPIAIVQTPFAELDARFSPDMKWISYSSNASGRSEIYVRPFNAASPASSPSGAIIVSKDGGSLARWRRDGRELFFQTPDGKVAAVGLETSGGQVKPGVPVVLFTLPWLTYWDVTGDGQRFLVTMPPAEGGLAPINVLLNWSLR
jgi:Tol biopolymer transport system component